MYNCEHCNKKYSTKGILEKHKTTAKFCLKIQNNKELNIFNCNFCEDSFSHKHVLERHQYTCKIKLEKIKEENEKIKEENDKKKDQLINKLQEDNKKLREDFTKCQTDFFIQRKELSIKDEIIQELKKEIQELKKEIQELKKESKDTYNTIIEKEEKLIDTLLQHNSSIQSQPKTINNNLIVNNYGIKPFTNDIVLEAFETYNLKNKSAFNCYVYNSLTGDKEDYKIEYILQGIAKELKDYYGITDISREKIIYNKNGEMLKTTASEFIKTNIVMNNVDAILGWISNLISQIYKKIEDGYNVTFDGKTVELTEEDKSRLLDKKDGLSSISNLFESSKQRGNVNICLEKYMKEEMIRNGKIIEKEVKKLK
jgi:hypothetical protein